MGPGPGIHGRTDLLRGRGGLVGGHADPAGVLALQRLLQLGDGRLGLLPHILRHLVRLVAEQLLGVVDKGLGGVAGLGRLALAAVLLRVPLGLAHHPVDVVLRQRGAAGHGHPLLPAGAEVLRRHMHDAVGVDVEGDLDLRHTARGRRQAGQLEHAELLVVRRDLALALVDLDLHGRLVVLGRGEDLRALGRNGRVALDQLGHDAALGLDTQGQRGDVQQQDVLDLTPEDTGLERGADRDHLVRVDAPVRVLAGQLPDQPGHGGHPGRAADQDHMVDIGHLDPGILDRLVERPLATVQQILGQLLELGAGQLLVQVQRALVGRRDVGQVDGGLGRGGQLDLRLLRRFAQPLQRHLVLGQVDPVPALEPGDEVVDDPLVPVVAAEVGVAVGGLDLDDPLADLQQRDIEGAAAEVEDQDGLVVLLVQAIRQGGGRRLVDDPQYLQAGDLARLLGGGALGVVEVRRDGDHRVRDVLAEVALRVTLELLQHTRGDLLRGVALAVHLAGGREAPLRLPHVALDRPRGALHVGHRLTLGHLAHQHLAVLGEGHHGRGRPGALGVGDDGRLATFQDAHHGVRRPQVDPDCAGHLSTPLLRDGSPSQSDPIHAQCYKTTPL
ncbi:putative NAD-specific glutamate dehydrogenase [Streptomyces bingchenggensis BCW-1]|uniref:Putative NAD-specific glutamate dehydrogenase n=1 Tax=Streptomyces bingchenggensis (strain BCW-1) TaxID=749414 RepID=D7C649_STRBB|nr:putative NAD-specific glutamate dehydrogenase [Streptomyces bingchenggensis BCW-1]